MKQSKSPLVVLLALSLGTAASCQPASSGDDPPASDRGSGGSTSSGGRSGGTSSGGSSGSTSSGGSSGSTSSGGSTGSSGGSTGSSGGSSGTSSGGSSGSSSGGSTGSSGGSTGSSGGSTGSTGGATGSDAGSTADTGTPPAGGKMVLTVDDDKTTSTPTRLCFKPEASNSGGNKSPKIDWTAPPAGTMSLVLMMEDLTNTTPHRIVCNMKPTETGLPADIKTMVPEGAQAGTGHGKPGDMWYGPGAGGAAHQYEITIFALATPMLEGGCGPGKKAIPARDYLKKNKMNKAVVLDWDAKSLWGNVSGSCK